VILDYTALAGPAFFVLIAVELFFAHRRGLPYYRLNDAINDVSTGILMQLTQLVGKGLLLAGYFAIYENLRFADLPAAQPVTWVACFLAVDCTYYWFHRLSHEINFLWAAHVVHHQSEDYNLAVALRQSTLQPVFASFFYWPLALVGFPPLVFLVCASFNTIYQFWLHTQAIRTLGPLEAVLVTPSHHRVHHGRNPIYLDRNHGGTFIIWDRLFGTFEREGEEVVYGITKPLESWNPVWANLHYWVDLFRTARATRRPIDKLRTFTRPPGWFPEDQGGVVAPPPAANLPRKFDRPYPRPLASYALLQFASLVAVTVALIFFETAIGPAAKTGGIILVAWGLVNIGGLFEGRAWSFTSEAARVVAAPLLPLVLLSGSPAWATAALLALVTAAFGVRVIGLRRFFSGGAAVAAKADPA
jgi:sterol desaturase/sphingolipid hydroxylase (fatty acid hydroxylase superfamily)